MARRTPKVARFTQWGELAVALLLAGTIILAIFLHLGPATVLTGGLVLFLLGWSSWKRHHLANLALLVDERDRRSFIRSSLQAKEAELRRSALGLALLLPSVLLSLLLTFAMRHPTGQGALGPFLLEALSNRRGLVVIGFVAAALLILARSHRRVRREVAALALLQLDYEQEAAREALADRP